MWYFYTLQNIVYKNIWYFYTLQNKIHIVKDERQNVFKYKNKWLNSRIVNSNDNQTQERQVSAMGKVDTEPH